MKIHAFNYSSVFLADNDVDHHILIHLHYLKRTEGMPHKWHITHTGDGLGWLGNQVGYSLTPRDTGGTESGIRDWLKLKKKTCLYITFRIFRTMAKYPVGPQPVPSSNDAICENKKHVQRFKKKWYPSGVKVNKDLYRQTCHISLTIRGKKIVDHSDVFVGSHFRAAPTTYLFTSWHLASMAVEQRQLQDETRIISVLWIGTPYVRGLMVAIQ